jgi:hypothetical protein
MEKIITPKDLQLIVLVDNTFRNLVVTGENFIAEGSENYKDFYYKVVALYDPDTEVHRHNFDRSLGRREYPHTDSGKYFENDWEIVLDGPVAPSSLIPLPHYTKVHHIISSVHAMPDYVKTEVESLRQFLDLVGKKAQEVTKSLKHTGLNADVACFHRIFHCLRNSNWDYEGDVIFYQKRSE